MSAAPHAVSEMNPRLDAIPSEFHMPSVISSAVMISWVKWLLKTRGLNGTFQWLRQRLQHVPASEDVSIETVRMAEIPVAVASALYPGRALCVEQSLALYYLLRRQGVAARYRQGVQPHPFVAHSWVEYRGEVINDVAEHAEWFTPLPDPLI